jgi:lysophospholipase L1-like esterase
MFGSGGFEPPGGQETKAGLYCYASASGQVPYSESNLGWVNLDPNATNRLPEYESLAGGGTYGASTYIGQVLGGNGNPAMQCGATLRARTGIDTYVYHTAAGGTTADFWHSGIGWDTLERTVPTALAAIPGSPAAFDVILISMGGNEALGGVPAETHYTNMETVRSQMVAEGWWVPGTTQIVILDMPRTGPLAATFMAYEGNYYVRTRFNDRIATTDSTGYELEPTFPVHYLPPYYSNAGKQAGSKIVSHIPIPWFYNKTVVAAACIGDSNAFASGGFTPPGGQTANTGVYCYASASGQTPYDEANMGWRNLDPNGTARIDEYTSYLATVGNIGFIGQMLGGNGNSGMQAASTVEQDIHLDNYLYQCAAGGTTADFWANGDGWDTLERTIPTALESIPGSPTAFDYILFSLGVNDATQDYTAEQFYTHFKTLRTKMVAAGWWIPGTTQIIILDTPKSGSFADDYSDWEGLTEVLTRFNDLIAITDSTGYELDEELDVHYLPPYYTDAGVQAGELVLSDIQRKPKTLSVAGTRVTIGGSAIQIYGTAA